MWGGVTTRPSGINSVRAVGASRESALRSGKMLESVKCPSCSQRPTSRVYCLSVAEKALLDAIHGGNAQWSQTQCPSSATTSSSLLPAVFTAATLHLSLRAKLEEVDSTQMIQTIPEFVTVVALPYSALQQGHSTADDGKIAQMKQSVTRNMLQYPFPERNLKCFMDVMAKAPDVLGHKRAAKSSPTAESVAIELEALNCALPWDLIVAYLNWICAQDGKVATSKAWESLEDLESQEETTKESRFPFAMMHMMMQSEMNHKFCLSLRDQEKGNNLIAYGEHPTRDIATATLVPPESTPTSTSAFMTQAPHEPLMKSVHQIVLNPKIISPLQSQTKIAPPVPLSMLLTRLVGKKQVTVNQTLPPKWQPISNLKLHKKSMVEKENNHCPVGGHPN
ncbi:hypothetical protein Pelo_2674 [Pelomyxa schiedti]|nr:hypothetical protein Pelo_2674 [Pelomyxa schiedti]